MGRLVDDADQFRGRALDVIDGPGVGLHYIDVFLRANYRKAVGKLLGCALDESTDASRANPGAR
jgi:hypothetical protein